MSANDILAGSHPVREKQAGECNFDPTQIGERIRQRQRERAASGVRYVSFARPKGSKEGWCVVREEPEK